MSCSPLIALLACLLISRRISNCARPGCILPETGSPPRELPRGLAKTTASSSAVSSTPRATLNSHSLPHSTSQGSITTTSMQPSLLTPLSVETAATVALWSAHSPAALSLRQLRNRLNRCKSSKRSDNSDATIPLTHPLSTDQQLLGCSICRHESLNCPC